MAFGWNNERIARALHVTANTLRKHYLRELRFRDEARDRLDATLAMRLWQEVEGVNTGTLLQLQRPLLCLVLDWPVLRSKR